VRGVNGAADFSMTRVKELTIPGFGAAHNVDFLVGGNSLAEAALARWARTSLAAPIPNTIWRTA